MKKKIELLQEERNLYHDKLMTMNKENEDLLKANNGLIERIKAPKKAKNA